MSSSSDTDDIEIDGFPPELANNARFVSLKSNNESLSSQKVYLPLTSWNADILPMEVIKTCIKALKDPFSCTEIEKQQMLEQLEVHFQTTYDSLNSDHEWQAKSHSTNLRQHIPKYDIKNSSSIKVNIEIPSMNANSNNIKYSIDKPVYDTEQQCWKTSMDFLIESENRTISEIQNEIYQENRATQTENIFDDSQLISLSKPIGSDVRCRSEERIKMPILNRSENSQNKVEMDVDIAFLEKMENSFASKFEKPSVLKLKAIFKNYQTIVQNNIDKYHREVKKLRNECDNLMKHSYEKLSESQFKWNAQNQLMLSDVEKEIDLLKNRLKIKNENVKRILQFCDKNESSEIENEMKNSGFCYSIKLISQMIINLKKQIATLNRELNGKCKQGPFKFK